jgi:hypothetical protein
LFNRYRVSVIGSRDVAQTVVEDAESNVIARKFASTTA